MSSPKLNGVMRGGTGKWLVWKGEKWFLLKSDMFGEIHVKASVPLSAEMRSIFGLAPLV
jgi:hypothetical protein